VQKILMKLARSARQEKAAAHRSDGKILPPAARIDRARLNRDPYFSQPAAIFPLARHLLITMRNAKPIDEDVP
jgi:hypothetical protein